MAPSMLPAPMKDTACSGPFPPNTTATRIFRCTFTLPPVVPPSGEVSDAIAFRLRGAAGKLDHRLADLQPVPDDRHHDLGDRHLHALPARQLQHGLRRFHALDRKSAV